VIITPEEDSLLALAGLASKMRTETTSSPGITRLACDVVNFAPLGGMGQAGK
jgi:hypothetical protein